MISGPFIKMTSTKMHDDVADALRKKKINELSKSVRRKYLALKLGKSEDDDALQKIFQPLTSPLKQIATTSKVIKEKLDGTLSNIKRSRAKSLGLKKE